MINKLVAPPVFPESDKTRIAQADHWVLVTAIGALLTVAGVQLAVGVRSWAHFAVYLSMLVAVLAAFPLVRTGRLRLAGAVVSTAFWIIVSATVVWLPEVRPAAQAAYLVIVLIGGFMWDRRAAPWLAAATSVFLAIVGFASATGWMPEHLRVVRPLGIWLEMTSLLFAAATTVILGLRNLRTVSLTAAQNAARYRALFEQTHESVIIIGMDRKVLLANRRAEHMFGYERGGLVGVRVSDLVAPRDRAKLERAAAHIKERSMLPLFDFVGQRRDGREFALEGTSTLVKDVDGTLLHVQATMRDVTQRKRADDELRASRERYAMAVAHGKTGVWEIVPDRGKLYTDHVFGSLLGFGSDELSDDLGQWAACIHPDDRDTVRDVQRQLHEGAIDEFAFEHRCVRKDGSAFWAHTTGHAAAAAPGGPMRIVGATTDVTERKEAETSKADLEGRLRHAYKMEAVGQLTGGIAHDFNNLLAVVIGNLELARENDDDPGRPAMLLQALGAAERGAELTQRLLAFSRKQPLKPKVTRLNDLIVGMKELVQRSIGATITVDRELQGDLWNCFVDPHGTENAFLNLILNARDAMPDGGHLVISTSNASLTTADLLGVDGVKPGRFVRLAITDTGQGMPQSVIEQAFDPFFTTKPQGQGSGLGLSMVYGFARQSGGYVTIDSTPAEGTTVNIFLPRTNSEGPVVSAAGRGGGEVWGAGQRILVVEDDAELRSFVVRLLRKLGYEPHAAEDGVAGLRLLRELGTVDMLLTDVILPGLMTGRDVGVEARRVLPELPVLYMSGYSRDVLMSEDRLDPGVELLEKPFKMAALAERLEAMLGPAASCGHGSSLPQPRARTGTDP